VTPARLEYIRIEYRGREGFLTICETPPDLVLVSLDDVR